jgi:hypothetical protein
MLGSDVFLYIYTVVQSLYACNVKLILTNESPSMITFGLHEPRRPITALISIHHLLIPECSWPRPFCLAEQVVEKTIPLVFVVIQFTKYDNVRTLRGVIEMIFHIISFITLDMTSDKTLDIVKTQQLN